MAYRSRRSAAAAKKSGLTPVLTLKGHTKSVPSISYFSDSKRMISGSRDGSARRWDLEVGKEIEEPRDVGIWQEVDAVAVSRDGRWVVMGGGPFLTGNLRVCEVETGIVKIFEGHSGWITCIDISADSMLLASGANDSMVQIRNLDTGKLVAGPFKSNDHVGAVRFSQDSKKIAVKSNVARCFEVWDVQTQKLDVRLRARGSHLTGHQIVFWTSKDKTIVTTSGFTDFDSLDTIYEIDASTLETVGTSFKGHTDNIDGLALSFDCALLASCSKDQSIKLWAFKSRQLLASFPVQNPRLIIFSPDSRQLAYTIWYNADIYVCNTPPKILDSIQPAHQVPRTDSPINTPLVYLPNSDLARAAAVHHNLTISSRPTSRGGGWTESSTIRHAGTSRIQPADMRLPSLDTWWSPTDTQRHPELQSVPQDFHKGFVLDLPSTTKSPIVALLSLPQKSSPEIGSRIPQPYPHPRELLPSSAHTDTVLPVRNHESGESDHNTMLQNLTEYITKDGNYPVTRPPTDMQRQHHDTGLQSLPQDLLYAHGGPAPDLHSTTISPVVALLPLPRSSSPAIGSQLPQSYPHPSSSHTDTDLSFRNHQSGDQDPEAILQNITGYVTKDEDYPAARGGFGEIWKCTYSIDRRLIKVAVKALQVYAADHLGPAKTKKNKRIKRELRICANLKHKNILPVYGYTYGFGPFIAIVSPWAENGNLTAYLERVGAHLTVLRRFEILRDITAGLQYLHANSVVHGDFNGPNVLIYGDGTACIADFGLSLMYSEVISASQASWTSALKGNMRWMAPELLEDREDGSQVRPSEHSDMYSFGGIMLQVLTNKTPYYHLLNDAAIVLCIAKSQTPSRSRYPVLPDKYWEFIEECWSTDPRDRPSTERADGMIRNEYYALSRSP